VTIPAGNSNPYFETDAANWTAFGGSAVRSTAQFHQGAASLMLTPDGVTATARVRSELVTGVIPGAEWRASAWVRCVVTRTVTISINWYDAADALLSTSNIGGDYAVTAGVWAAVSITATAPATAAKAALNVSMSGTPTSGQLLYTDEAIIRPAGQIVVTAEPNNSPPRVLIELEYTGGAEATIVRTDPDGTQTPVRLAEPAELDGSGSAVLYDYESWFGGATTYTATTTTGAVTSTSVTLDVEDAWLRHPGVPSLSQTVDFQGEGKPVRPVTQAVLEPLGRSTPVVVSDGQRKSKRGDLTLRTKNDAEHIALLALLDDVTPLLLDIPASYSYGTDLRHQYLAIGDLTQNRLMEDYYPHPWRIWTAPYIAVGRPAGGIQAQRTYATVLAAGATYQGTLTRHATYTALLTGA
jgi:hypothetical protein